MKALSNFSSYGIRNSPGKMKRVSIDYSFQKNRSQSPDFKTPCSPLVGKIKYLSKRDRCLLVSLNLHRQVALGSNVTTLLSSLKDKDCLSHFFFLQEAITNCTCSCGSYLRTMLITSFYIQNDLRTDFNKHFVN